LRRFLFPPLLVALETGKQGKPEKGGERRRRRKRKRKRRRRRIRRRSKGKDLTGSDYMKSQHRRQYHPPPILFPVIQPFDNLLILSLSMKNR